MQWGDVFTRIHQYFETLTFCGSTHLKLRIYLSVGTYRDAINVIPSCYSKQDIESTSSSKDVAYPNYLSISAQFLKKSDGCLQQRRNSIR